MARQPLPIPGRDKDYNSRKSRARLLNLMVRTNADGSFRSIVKREGIAVQATTPNGDAICSNFSIDFRLGGTPEAYFCGATNFYGIDSDGNINDNGAHGIFAGAGNAHAIITNTQPIRS